MPEDSRTGDQVERYMSCCRNIQAREMVEPQPPLSLINLRYVAIGLPPGRAVDLDYYP